MLLTIMATICHVAIAQVPTISSFTPASGAIGTPVVISGANFSTTAADNIVYFGAVKAVLQSAGSTTLTVIVPAGASYHPISVAVNNLIAYTVSPFMVPAKPVLSQLNDTTFCENGNVNFVSNLNNNNQWFKNNTLINNATGTSYNATTTGDYFVRVMNGASCYNYSDTVSITVLPAPATPVAIVTGNLTFCIGDSVRLQSTAASGNQWYLGGTHFDRRL